eukprot:SAG31_NODE_1857_length_7062_cov_6.624587_4_plen_160_part_00
MARAGFRKGDGASLALEADLPRCLAGTLPYAAVGPLLRPWRLAERPVRAAALTTALARAKVSFAASSSAQVAYSARRNLFGFELYQYTRNLYVAHLQRSAGFGFDTLHSCCYRPNRSFFSFAQSAMVLQLRVVSEKSTGYSFGGRCTAMFETKSIGYDS